MAVGAVTLTVAYLLLLIPERSGYEAPYWALVSLAREVKEQVT